MSDEVRNSFKVRVLILLERSLHRIYEWGEAAAWYTPRDIHYSTGVNLDSCYVLLPRWAKNGWYVDSQYLPAELTSDARPHTFYRINSKGLSYIRRMSTWYAGYDEAKAALDEIEANAPTTPEIVPRRVGWHVPAYMGSKLGVVANSVILSWPFKTKADVKRYWYAIGTRSTTGTRFYVAPDIKVAVELVIRTLYKMEPALECVEAAIEIQNSMIKEASKYAKITRTPF
jgi:hypothetical protein